MDSECLALLFPLRKVVLWVFGRCVLGHGVPF